MLEDRTLVFKFYSIGRLIGVSERTIRREVTRAKLILPKSDGCVYIPYTQIKALVWRLQRSKVILSIDKIRFKRHNFCVSTLYLFQDVPAKYLTNSAATDLGRGQNQNKSSNQDP